MKTYPKYKPSGIEWIGEIPEHWEAKRLKFVGESNPSNVDKKSVEGEKAVFLCNYVDVYKNDFITSDLAFMAATASQDQIEKFSLKKGDVIATKDSEDPNDIAVPALVAEDMENVICGYHLTHIRPNKEILFGSFLFRVFQSDKFNKQFTIKANGVTRYGLPISAFTDACIYLPPLPEQTAIAAYLDAKTARIDGFIAAKQKLITLLKEERTGIINQAVTKGLNPNVPMKPSGIEWLGEIPVHWEVKKLKYVAQINPSKSEIDSNLDNSTLVTFLPMERVSESGEISCDNKKPISELINGFTYFRRNDIIVAKITPCFENGKGAFLDHLDTEFGFGSTEFHVLRTKTGVQPGYLYCITKTDLFMSFGEAFMSGAAGQKRVPTDFVSEFCFPFPCEKEQFEILKFLSTETTKIDTTISKIEKEIELMQEYRTALINEVVTGKICVV